MSSWLLPLKSNYAYTLLGAKPHRSITRRTIALCAAGLLTASLLVSVVVWRNSIAEPDPYEPHLLPPLYEPYHEAELGLPQHHWNQSAPAEDEKFFYVAGHLHGLGWNNILQELLFNAYLAYRSGRSFVYSNYTWDESGLYSSFKDKDNKVHRIPSQIPLTAFIRGPLVGGQWPAASSAPLSVSWDYFNHTCPRRYGIDDQGVNGDKPAPTNAQTITDRWSSKLKSIDDPCVESTREMDYVYSHQWIFGVRGSLDEIWPEFSRSPIITHFSFSPLVELGFDNNRDIFLPAAARLAQPLLTGQPLSTNAERYTMIPGLMVIHVRRGDYYHHCDFLAEGPEDFIVTNTLVGTDEFSLPSPPGIMEQLYTPTTWRREKHHKLTPESKEVYKRRCYPSIEQIAAKVADVLNTPAARGISTLYIMTNGQEAYLKDLRGALAGVKDDWEMIATSRDLALNWEQKHISQAVDALAAQRAQVLIGNGFSTLTSNAVMFRNANGFPVNSTRFW